MFKIIEQDIDCLFKIAALGNKNLFTIYIYIGICEFIFKIISLLCAIYICMWIYEYIFKMISLRKK